MVSEKLQEAIKTASHSDVLKSARLKRLGKLANITQRRCRTEWE